MDIKKIFELVQSGQLLQVQKVLNKLQTKEQNRKQRIRQVAQQIAEELLSSNKWKKYKPIKIYIEDFESLVIKYLVLNLQANKIKEAQSQLRQILIVLLSLLPHSHKLHRIIQNSFSILLDSIWLSLIPFQLKENMQFRKNSPRKLSRCMVKGGAAKFIQ